MGIQMIGAPRIPCRHYQNRTKQKKKYFKGCKGTLRIHLQKKTLEYCEFYKKHN